MKVVPGVGKQGIPTVRVLMEESELAYTVRPEGEFAVAELLPTQPPCSTCQGTGRVIRMRDNVRMVGRCACQLVPDRLARFNHAGIPARHAASTLGSFAAGLSSEGSMRAFKGVGAWLDSFKQALEEKKTLPGLLLYGDVGRGKTHLLVGLVRVMILHLGLEVQFVDFSRLLATLRERYDRGDSDRALFNELTAVPILAIDEIGKGRLTEWELSVIDELVGRRYDAMACTLGTTNYPPAALASRRSDPFMDGPGSTQNLAEGTRLTKNLADRVGDRVYSRLREMCDFLEVGGLDYRITRPSAKATSR